MELCKMTLKNQLLTSLNTVRDIAENNSAVEFDNSSVVEFRSAVEFDSLRFAERCRIRQRFYYWKYTNLKRGSNKAQMEIISIGKSSICKKETFHPSIFIFNILLFFNKEKKNSPKLKCVGKKVRPFIGAPVHLWLKIFLVYLKLGWKIRFSVLALFISTFRSSSMKIFLFFSLPLSNSTALALSFSATLWASLRTF